MTVDNFRLWFTEHTLHGDEPELEGPRRVVSDMPVRHQALRDRAA